MLKSATQKRHLIMLSMLCLVPVGTLAAMSTQGRTDAAGPCEIRATKQAGMVTLDALVHADRTAGGTYSFRIEKSGGGGSSTVSQGGAFETGAGQSAPLASVSVDAKGSAYSAVLEGELAGKTFRCTAKSGV
ncbi:hypothetical protein SAMN05880582_11098 [Rhizobium sp. RU20A]|uniref:curli-like amyloid fiber formation chaperone CsgH n=1 Tax=Rhizobium sp. RU20A TaxID=1907412 RepID=UPI000953D182|nr:curli-like amyloid fiber formation chaperone CsgH [Rhizobium sp. RU20A]SIR33791.1 hypothetical protein SAMN05880582_11098 [Rhizobium sp. RU20A]